MEEQFQNYLNQHTVQPPPIFSGNTTAVPSSLDLKNLGNVAHTSSQSCIKGGGGIVGQIYKYVKWFTIVIIVAVIIYFLHSFTKQYFFPTTKVTAPAAPSCGLQPKHEGQPPLPTVSLNNEYENNTFTEGGDDANLADDDNVVLQEVELQEDEEQEIEEEEEHDENFTSLKELSNS